MRALSLLALVAAAVLPLLGVGCDDDSNPNVTYSPNKNTFELTAANYVNQPVVDTADGIQATGRAANVTDRVQADTLALHDAAHLMLRNALVPALSTKHPQAGRFFTEQPSLALDTIERAMESGREPIFAATQIAPDRGFVYELYRVFNLPAAKRLDVLERLADLYRQLAEAAMPIDVEFSVLLSDLQRVSYQERLKMVISAVQSKIGELGYGGEVIAVDADQRISPDELARRKRDLVAGIPNGANVEISLSLSLTSRNKIKQVALFDTRLRKSPPIVIAEHPEPVGGRYQYNLAVASHYVKKGAETLRLEITEFNGTAYVQDYELAGRFQYSTGNIGLLMIKGFKGHLQNLTLRLKESIRLPDEEGKPTVMLDFDTRVALTGQVGTSIGGAERGYNYRIGLFRPSTTTVWTLNDTKMPDPGAFSDPNRVAALPWQIVWQEEDPDRKFGELNDIRVEAKSTKLVVRVAYNGGKDYDILLFDFEGKDAKAVLREPVTLYSSRSRQ